MPEPLDIAAHISALEQEQVASRAAAYHERRGRIVRQLIRVGMRIAIDVDNDLRLVLHYENRVPTTAKPVYQRLKQKMSPARPA